MADNIGSLEIQVGEALRARSLTVATAESCTGGLLCKRLTDVSGSSAYVVGGIVAYSTVIKQQMLGVMETMLAEHGPVSEPVARQMAHSVRILFGVDCALSITGIAGPEGGTETGPVGLTFIGLSTVSGTHVRRFQWGGSRAENREHAATAALQMLLDYLNGQA